MFTLVGGNEQHNTVLAQQIDYLQAAARCAMEFSMLLRFNAKIE